MATLIRKGSTSNILRIVLPTDTADNTTEGLKIATICDNEAIPIVYTGSQILSVGSIGQFQIMPSGTCCFKKVSPDVPFLYELHLPNSRFSVPDSNSLIINISFGALRVQNAHYEITLNVYDKMYNKFVEGDNNLLFQISPFLVNAIVNNAKQEILASINTLSNSDEYEIRTFESYDNNFTPLQYVKAWLTSDFKGEKRVSEVAYSNSDGIVTFSVQKGRQFYLWRYHPSVLFQNPLIV